MRRRNFISSTSAGLLTAALAQRPNMGYAEPPREVAQKNWVWLHARRRPAEQWRRMFGELAQHGIQAVVPEVYNGSRAQFPTTRTEIQSQSDALRELIPHAHAAGLEVHAWMWTVPCLNRAIREAHPEWYAVNREGDSTCTDPAYVDYYRFMCPRRAAVRDFVSSIVADLARIEPLDGIHLDYVRLPDVILAKGLWKRYGIVQDKEYPRYDYCYCAACRTEFKAASGADPLTDLEDPTADEAWRQFRYDSVTGLVNEHLVPVARDAGKQITAAVFPNWQFVRQEWHRWDLDGFLPMLYHSFYEEPVEWVGQETAAALARLDDLKPVYAGLFLHALNADDLATAIESARAGGAAGVALFSQTAIKPHHVDVLEAVLAAKAGS